MKKSSVLAAVLTLGIATAATTACAFENEFHGMFAARYINSNFNGTSTTNDPVTNPAGDAARYGGDGQYFPANKPKNVYSANLIEQRARLQYSAKASADLKLVTQFELDYTYWGNSSYTTGRNQGGAVGADTVNIETKHIYIDANPYKNVNMKLGMQPYNDSFKGVLFDADMAGIAFSSSYKNFTPSIGYFRFDDSGVSQDKVLGHMTNDLFLLDGKYQVNKDLKVGAAYYLFRNNSETTNANTIGFNPQRQDVKMSTLGLNTEYTSGPLTLNGFGVLQVGTANKRATTAWALNTGAKYKVGPGTARCEFLYISGDNNSTGHSNAFYSVFNIFGAEHGYYDNEMAILGRDKNAYTTDNAIIGTAGNLAQGQIGGYIGYDLPINAKLTTAFNAGFAAVAKENSNKPTNNKTGRKNESNYLGTELNAEATYQLMDGLTVGTRVAYVILGDYYNEVASNGTPVNPYDAKLMFKYTF
jgi:hypothetical protein